MKKSEVLSILGDYAVSNKSKILRNAKLLVIEVKALTAYHMAFLDKYILSIDPTDKSTMLVYFCSSIEID